MNKPYRSTRTSYRHGCWLVFNHVHYPSNRVVFFATASTISHFLLEMYILVIIIITIIHPLLQYTHQSAHTIYAHANYSHIFGILINQGLVLIISQLYPLLLLLFTVSRWSLTVRMVTRKWPHFSRIGQFSIPRLRLCWITPSRTTLPWNTI